MISVAICTVAPLALLDLVYDGCEMVRSAQIIVDEDCWNYGELFTEQLVICVFVPARGFLWLC